MFNKTYIQDGRTEYVPYEKNVTINEHKAPTDKSIELLNEFKDKATKDIICSIKIDENYIKGSFIAFQQSFPNDSVRFYLRFNLNGNEYLFEDNIDRREFNEQMVINIQHNEFNPQKHNKTIINFIHRKFSECIAMNLIQQNPEFIRNILNPK